MKNIFTLWIPVLLFHLLFWEAEQGLNILLFTWVLTGGIYLKKQYAFERKQVYLLLGAWNISALFVAIHNSLLSIFVYGVFSFVLIGFLQELTIRSWFLNLIESLRALFGGWVIGIKHSLQKRPDFSGQYGAAFRKIRLLVLPLIIIVPFYFVYVQANADFAQLSTQFWSKINQFFQFDLDGGRIAHFILGILLVSAVISTRYGLPELYNMDKSLQNNLTRTRRSFPWSHKMLALKNEYHIAVLSFISLNILLVLVNLLDIYNVWFSFEEKTATELSQYVHQGTYLLILSIFMAMIVVLGFLRKNLNFYTENKFLLKLIYIWLAQNAFLAISVAIRNGHYISHYGLAHGRIEVIFFLLLVLFGLYSMYQKVKEPKTVFYLIQKNGWAFLTMLLLSSSVNWDAFITRYNLKHHANDVYYITHRLQNNLVPLIDDFNGKNGDEPTIELKDFISKGESHARRWENSDWRSWTWGGYQQYRAWKNLDKKDVE